MTLSTDPGTDYRSSGNRLHNLFTEHLHPQEKNDILPLGTTLLPLSSFLPLLDSSKPVSSSRQCGLMDN
ncbi:hypothetical protein CEXT_227921 [Caerostris extrusa]|uniref:Uncharacterized protein n=1 Tax=Caerostris extrusa TaxID=172846 RepID=A0AAV4SIM9_CAEEX|nr:hypothetical protein CEXT_227921 [Caerostris extrusa]